jgi:phosphatidylglycerol---prolipoprotein diacylglyceryl transferase
VSRPGVLLLFYLYAYSITQFLLFFARDNIVVTFLGLDWGLKQAQWTSLVLLVVLLPITYLISRYSKPIPEGEVAATYGIPQKEKAVTAENRGGEQAAGEIAPETAETTAGEGAERLETPHDAKT